MIPAYTRHEIQMYYFFSPFLMKKFMSSEIKGKDSKGCNTFKKDGKVKESHCTDSRRVICGSKY